MSIFLDTICLDMLEPRPYERGNGEASTESQPISFAAVSPANSAHLLVRVKPRLDRSFRISVTGE